MQIAAHEASGRRDSAYVIDIPKESSGGVRILPTSTITKARTNESTK